MRPHPPYIRERLSTIRAMPKHRARISPTEHQEQVTLVDWWDMTCARHGLRPNTLFAIPNAGAGSQKGQAGKMKGEGTRKGIPDLMLAAPRGGSHGLFIEMKSRTGSVSPDQKAELAALTSEGYTTAVCFSCDEAMTVILKYLAA